MRILFILIAAFFCENAAISQVHRPNKDSADLETTRNLNPIVVTGTGHHQRLKTTSTPVHVLTMQEMQEQGIMTLDAAITKMLPQASIVPNSMGSFLRLNGLGNKYILILINGKKLSGDISNNVDLNRVNMSRVKRIEVLDGAASSLYGTDAIAGVINIITDQPTDQLVGVTSSSRISGKGQFTESVALDLFHNGFGSYTSFTHDQAHSYQNNDLEYLKGSDTETRKTIAPLFTGFNAQTLEQRFNYAVNDNLAFNALVNYSYKITDRPETQADVTGGTDYEMRHKGLRMSAGGIYKFNSRQSLQADFTVDKYRYGKEYDVETTDYAIGDYVQSKKQHTYEGEMKAILHPFSPDTKMGSATTVLGVDWRRDQLQAVSGNIRQHASQVAAYAQHEQDLLPVLKATLGVRYTYHENFGSHFTPKASLMYTVGLLNFRASYSAGFRAPGLDELYYHYFSVNRGKPQIIFGDKNLEPEKSHYWSINTEYRSKALAVSVTGFVNRIHDMVVRNNISVDEKTLDMLRTEFPEMTDDQADKLERYSLYVNHNSGKVMGVQVNISANVTGGLNITANYACTNAKSGDGETWTVLERSIRNTGTIAANYHHRVNKLYAFNININGRFQSKTYYPDYENAPGYGVLNLHTSHRLHIRKGIVLEPSLGIDNIFDKVDRRVDSSMRRFALISPGRMVVAGLIVKFNGK